MAGEPPAGTVTWRELHRGATERLESAMEARWLVEEAAPEPWPAALDRPATVRAHAYFSEMLERRAAGEPLQYVLGHWAFRRLDLLVDPRVLIPRPETEVVVDVALAELEAVHPGGRGGRAADLGTGSGAIGLSLAKERPGLEVWATDTSPAALEVAAANLAGLGGYAAPRVRLCRGSWFDALPPALVGRLDLVVSNPPYIGLGELADLDAMVVDHEPHEALFAGPTGLEDVEAVVAGAPRWLAPGGALVVELAPAQAPAAMEAAHAAGLVDVRVAPDLAGRDRALVARRP